MATAFKRETMIALRARRTAYRIATDFLYPPVALPAPPEPAIPIDDRPIPKQPYFTPTKISLLAAAVILWTLAALMFYLNFHSHGKFP